MIFRSTPTRSSGSITEEATLRLRLNPSKSFQAGLLYSTYLGGKAGDVSYGITGDSAGYIYVTGYTLSSDFPVAGKAPQGNWGGGTDIYVTKFKTGVAGTAAIDFSTFLGATNIYVPASISVGADGRIYVTGRGGIGLPSSQYAIQGGYAGGSTDGFIFVLTPDAGSQSQTTSTQPTEPSQSQTPTSLPAARRHPEARSSTAPRR